MNTLPELVSVFDLSPVALADFDRPMDDEYAVTVTDDAGQLRLAPRYKNLGSAQGDYVLWLTRMGLAQKAGYVANCRRHGSVYQECPARERNLI